MAREDRIELKARMVTERLATLSAQPLADFAVLERLICQRAQEAPAHADLVREGESSAGIRMMLGGWACRYKMLVNGRRQLLSFVLPGELCDPYMHLLARMDHSLAALTPVTYAQLGREESERLVHDHPAVARALWIQTMFEIGVEREWTASLGQRVAFQRLAHLFCDIYLRLNMTGIAEDNWCDFPPTQGDIGDATGLSSVHVNRTLQDLRAANLITLTNKRLFIRNLEALKSAALFRPSYGVVAH
ncbi:Crp/Fnr family transcriptional regulator [Ancylobacter sp. MQZ15Z-1]|uniref:Crp/Fnr family transcriptional regulator n=1 Tax=Ancylobacter mangrovi TaxID=2972472 RepID=A0A9X2P849_9HYPH|nr:Crp/Fnr family transcriptional regulator [Ancylobacter mangrovi]MCS0494007.1 Crp/Fnr family transcriptional regulator [Ancylobacter mangrovi]